MISDIEKTKAYQLLKKKESPFLDIINETYRYASSVLPKINRVFADYTGHGIEHSLNVMDYMYNLINTPEELSDLELTVLIYVALLHDVGMVVTTEEIEKIKKDDVSIVDRKYSLVLDKYQDENIALQECIRPIHGIRSLKYINCMKTEHFLIPEYTDISFRDDVAKICAAHNESFDWIKNNLYSDTVKGSYLLNSQFIALLLRLGDYLDIDESRAPLYLYKIINPKDYGDIEWKQHFVIENKDKIVIDENTKNKYIEFYGESSDPSIHRKLLRYFDLINGELKNAVAYSEKFRDKKYLLTVKTNIYNKIRTKGFNFSNFKLSLDYKAVTSLLMGENIYGDKRHGLRELIQNSIDACKVMQEESVGKHEFKYNPYSPFISIVLDEDRRQVILYDNGRGMSLEILKKYFLNVGVSYYKSDDYVFKGNKYAPIGNYGIGFLACFMLSDKVSVITKYFGETSSSKIEFETSSEYICLTYEDDPRGPGTEIVLDYDQFMSVFDNTHANIVKYIQALFLDCEIPIRVTRTKDGASIFKNINLRKIDEAIPEAISLNMYLDSVQAYIKFTYKGIDFPETFSDLVFNESYLYDGSKNSIIRDDDSCKINLKEYINNGELEYLTVPIISAAEIEDFEKAYDVLEDFDEALEKINYEEAYIITKDKSLYTSSDFIDNNWESIIGEYTLKQFQCETDHAYNAPTKTAIEKQRVIQGEGEKVLPYVDDVGFGYSFNHTDSIYIKNVLVSNVKLKIPFLIKGIQLQEAILNIRNKNVIPNISRNDISEQQNEKLSYAIGKAIHQWIYQNADFGKEEKSLIGQFIKTCYPNDNELMS